MTAREMNQPAQTTNCARPDGDRRIGPPAPAIPIVNVDRHRPANLPVWTG
jgi:hypothetical protein